MRRASNQSRQHRLTQYELGSSPASTPQSEGSALRLPSVLRVRSRAISVPLTRDCTELAALDAICRGLSVWNCALFLSLRRTLLVTSSSSVSLVIDRSAAEQRAILFSITMVRGECRKTLLKFCFSLSFESTGTGNRQAGNGLGLAIAVQAIRMHRGAISAKNVQPGGLEVTVVLPVRSKQIAVT